MAAEPRRRPLKWYLALAGIAAGIQATVLLSVAVTQSDKFEHAGPARYEPAVLDPLGRVLGAPIFPFFRPEWTFWLRAYVADDRWIMGFVALLNALVWGAAVAVSTWWWQRSVARQRLVGIAVVVGVICVGVVLVTTGTFYCHGDFSGILHCHSFATLDHDH